jgi:hypothetical protein
MLLLTSALWLLSRGSSQVHTNTMNSRVRTTYQEWQNAVHRHGEQLRDARRRRLTPIQIREATQGTLLAVDAAYERHKQAEAEQERGDATDMLEAALRAMSNALPKDQGSVH